MGWGEHNRVGVERGAVLPQQRNDRASYVRQLPPTVITQINNTRIDTTYINRDHDHHYRDRMGMLGKVLLGMDIAANVATAAEIAESGIPQPAVVDPAYVAPAAYSAAPPPMSPDVAAMYNNLAFSPNPLTRNAATNLVNRPMFQQLNPEAQKQLLHMIGVSPWVMPRIVSALNSCFRDTSGARLNDLQNLLTDYRFSGESENWKGNILNTFSFNPPTAFAMLGVRR